MVNYYCKEVVQSTYRRTNIRIQFTVSQLEWNTLKMKSIEDGYPDVPSFCKDMVIKQRTYAILWNTVTKK